MSAVIEDHDIAGRGSKPGDEPLGTLRGHELIVLASDGVPLHVEIDGPDTAPVTIIFCHGYTLNQDCWHFQRRDLADYRLVFWDQRDHGRSGRAEPDGATIDQLGADLKAVIDATVPGPATVVLVGHSMGQDVGARSPFRKNLLSRMKNRTELSRCCE